MEWLITVAPGIVVPCLLFCSITAGVYAWSHYRPPNIAFKNMSKVRLYTAICGSAFVLAIIVFLFGIMSIETHAH